VFFPQPEVTSSHAWHAVGGGRGCSSLSTNLVSFPYMEQQLMSHLGCQYTVQLENFHPNTSAANNMTNSL
jgi:hypothetical protein